MPKPFDPAHPFGPMGPQGGPQRTPPPATTPPTSQGDFPYGTGGSSTSPLAPASPPPDDTSSSPPTESPKQQAAAAKKAEAKKVESIKQQITDLTTGITWKQLQDPQQLSPLAQKLSGLLGQLPYGDAQNIMKGGAFKANPNLVTAVTQAASTPPPTGGAAAKPAAPFYDPLALQTMWHDVFGPAYAQASKIAGTAGTGYLDAMNQAIAGSHQNPQATAMLQGNAQATANLLQQFGRNQAQQVAAVPSYDALIAALGQGAAKAQLAQGAYERQASYQAYPSSLTGGTSGGAMSPAAAAAALNPIITGAPGSSTAGTNPLYPNIP